VSARLRRHIAIAVAVAALLPVGAVAGDDRKDLHFGEALYYAYQEHWFEALQRLDAEIAQHYGVDEPQLDSLYPHIKNANFDVGDFELRYRMHHRAGRAIRAVLEADVDEEVRNDAAFRLARIHFQKGQPEAALQVLERIDGKIPEAIRDDIEFLRANVYLALGRPSDAVAVLQRLQDSEALKGFSAYNLGVALLQDGRKKEALEQLDRAGRVESGDPAALAIVDKSNLVLGTLLFEASAFEPAERSLDRVRLEGPFSNQALLRAGWADASAEKFERALVPWSILAEREATDAAVQEAMLALPYAYSKLGVQGRAALLYGRAVEAFGDELGKLDASLESIANGAFLAALVREEIRLDKDWVIRLRSLPDAPETFYLMTLMASHEFQTGLQNYLDLEDMRKKVVAWRTSLDAFEDIIRVRRAYYEPLLPEVDRQFRELDSQIRLRVEQRDRIEARLQHMLIAPRPDHLATADEQRASAAIEALEARLQRASDAERSAHALRIRRLKGALIWSLELNYHQRLTDAHKHLRALNADVDAMTARYEAFVRARQAATLSYTGYEDGIGVLRARIADAAERLDVLMARQGHMLEVVANRELKQRRQHLEAQLNQARFAFADSYDRAAKAQAR
jgi:predicted negative regulator of RcsB-dependent stress response